MEKSKIKYTKLSAVLLLISAALAIILAALSTIPKSYLLSIVFYIPIAYFIYKEKRWAIVVAMILWSLDKFIQVDTNPAMAKSIFFWWIGYMSVFYLALMEVNENRPLKEKETPKASWKNYISKNNLVIFALGILFLITGAFLYQKQKIASCVIESKDKGILNEGSIADQVIQRYKGGNDDISKYQEFCSNIYSLF